MSDRTLYLFFYSSTVFLLMEREGLPTAILFQKKKKLWLAVLLPLLFYGRGSKTIARANVLLRTQNYSEAPNSITNNTDT